MTNTTPLDEVLKTDVLGRVKTPRGRQEALLDELLLRPSVSTLNWKGNIGKHWSEKVLRITQDLFAYLSTDGATAEEKKIAEASEVAFEKAAF